MREKKTGGFSIGAKILDGNNKIGVLTDGESIEDKSVSVANEEETFECITIRYFEERWSDETKKVVHLC